MIRTTDFSEPSGPEVKTRESSATPPATQGVTYAQAFAYALPAMLGGFVQGPIAGVVPALYAKQFGISLTFISAVLFASRLSDALIDPLIGLLSDRAQGRFGRKPWVAVGIVCGVTVTYLLFKPPAHVSSLYFAILMVLIFMCWSLTDIPHLAWAGELATGYGDRTRVAFVRSGVSLLGGIAISLLPLLPIFRSTEMSLEVLAFAANGVLVMGIIAIGAMWLAPIGTPQRVHGRVGILAAIGAASRNPIFLRFVAVLGASGLAGGLWGALSFIFWDAYLGIGSKFSALSLALVLPPILAIPFWAWLAGRIPKHRAWACGLGVGAVGVAIAWFAEPGQDAFFIMAVSMLVAGFGFGSNFITPMAMLGDICDHGYWKSRAPVAGLYTAVLVMVAKANAAVGAALGFGVIGWVGFEVGAKTHSTIAIAGLKGAAVLLPAALMVAAAVALFNYPLTHVAVEAIQRRLLRRQIAAGGDAQHE